MMGLYFTHILIALGLPKLKEMKVDETSFIYISSTSFQSIYNDGR